MNKSITIKCLCRTVKTLDMTNGAENRPISVMNDIDDDAMPSVSCYESYETTI